VPKINDEPVAMMGFFLGAPDLPPLPGNG